MFKCPRCLSLDSSVIESRYSKKLNSCVRIRTCKNCGNRYFTHERLVKYSSGLNKLSECYKEKHKEKSKRECKT